MKINWNQISVIVFLILILASCQQQFPGFQEAENGIYYQVHENGDGNAHPEISDWVTINMDYRLEDSVMFSSQNLAEPLRFPIIPAMFEGDLYAGLMMMSSGDSMSFAIVADSFFIKTALLKELPPNVEAGSSMYYDVKLLKVVSQEEYQIEVQQEGDRKLQEEMNLLGEYLEENKIQVQPTESGLYYMELEKGRGKKAVAGEMLSIYLTVSQLDGKKLFSNYNGNPLDIEFGKDFDTEGLMEGLGLMRAGGEAMLIVPSEIGVGPRGKDGVPAFTTLIYEVKLDQIKTIEQVKKEREARKLEKEKEDEARKNAEPGRISAYLQRNEIKTSPLESGLYFIQTAEGSGPYPVDGNKVKMHYILNSIDGELLQSSYGQNQTFDFEVGTAAVIQGWEEAIRLMQKGSKATIIVPSKLAYGARNRGEGIPAYSPLVFKIELMDIE